MGAMSSVSIGKGRWSEVGMAAGEVCDTGGCCKALVSSCGRTDLGPGSISASCGSAHWSFMGCGE